MKNENLELERRLMVSERECKHLQARAEGLWESLEDAENGYNSKGYQEALRALDGAAIREFRYVEAAE